MSRIRRRIVAVGIAGAALSAGMAQSASASLWTTPNELSPPGVYSQDTDVAAGANGDFVTIWREDVGDYLHEVIGARRITAAGGVGPAIDVTDRSASTGTRPQIAVAPDGTGVAAFGWTAGDYMSASTRYASTARISPAGTVGPVVGLDASGDTGQDEQVAVDGDGVATIVWTDTDDGRLYVSRTGPDGSVVMPEQAISPALDDDAAYPVVASNEDGVTGVAWWQIDADDVARVWVVMIAPDGTVGTPVPVSPVDVDMEPCDLPAVAIDDAGTLYVSYMAERDDDEVQLVSVSAAGVPSEVTVLTQPGVDGDLPAIAVRGDGSGMVVWQEDPGLRGVHLGPGGVLDGPAFDVFSGTVYYRPDVAVGNGNATVVFTEGTTKIQAIEYIGGEASDLITLAEPGGVFVREAQVASAPDGTSVATWEQYQFWPSYFSQGFATYGVTEPVAGTPSVSGGTTAGSVLTGDPGEWGGSANEYEWQWLRCSDAAGADCVPIEGATGLTYTTTAEDVGRHLAFRVTASNELASGVTATSAPYGPVTAAPVPPPASPPPVTPPAAGGSEPSESVTAPRRRSVTPSGPAAAVLLPRAARQRGLQAGVTGRTRVPLHCPSGIPGNCNASGALSVRLPEGVADDFTGGRAMARVDKVLARFAGIRIKSGTTRLYEVRLDPVTYAALQDAGIRRIPATLRTVNRLDGRTTIRASQRVWLRIALQRPEAVEPPAFTG